MLHYSDLTKRFVVETDASTEGLGAVLSQEKNGVLRPIAFASRSLHKAEKKWSVTDLECAAVLFAIRQFICYLYGTEFDLVTDHRALSVLSTQRALNARLHRWSCELQGFRFKVIHREGRKHLNADMLSRMGSRSTTLVPDDGSTTAETEFDETFNEIFTKPLSGASVISALVTDTDVCQLSPLFETDDEGKRPIQKAQKSDPNFRALLQYHQKQQVAWSDEQKKFVGKYHPFTRCLDGVLFYLRNKDDQAIFLPPSLHEEVICSYHDSVAAGHLSATKTCARLAARFFGLPFVKMCGITVSLVRFARDANPHVP